jgi:hypothetical protein
MTIHVSKPRDYSITIRNQADHYMRPGPKGEPLERRYYANMSSAEARGDEGAICLQIDRGQTITLTPAEALDIADTLKSAASGAQRTRPITADDIQVRSVSKTWTDFGCTTTVEVHVAGVKLRTNGTETLGFKGDIDNEDAKQRAIAKVLEIFGGAQP